MTYSVVDSLQNVIKIIYAKRDACTRINGEKSE